MSIFRIYFPNLIKNIFYLRFKLFVVLKIKVMLRSRPCHMDTGEVKSLKQNITWIFKNA